MQAGEALTWARLPNSPQYSRGRRPEQATGAVAGAPVAKPTTNHEHSFHWPSSQLRRSGNDSATLFRPTGIIQDRRANSRLLAFSRAVRLRLQATWRHSKIGVSGKIIQIAQKVITLDKNKQSPSYRTATQILAKINQQEMNKEP